MDMDVDKETNNNSGTIFLYLKTGVFIYLFEDGEYLQLASAFNSKEVKHPDYPSSSLRVCKNKTLSISLLLLLQHTQTHQT